MELKELFIKLHDIQLKMSEELYSKDSTSMMDEYIDTSELILSKFGLPPTTEYSSIIEFGEFIEGKDLEDSINLKIVKLKEVAEKYLTRPVVSDIELLIKSISEKSSAYDILPELNIIVHRYTKFVYEKFLLGEKTSPENFLIEIRSINHDSYDLLGELYYLKTDSNEFKEKLEILKSENIPYLEEYIQPIDKNGQHNGTQLLWNQLKSLHQYDSFDEQFEKLADSLMNSVLLSVGSTIYQVTECEIYYFETNKHEDIYVHKDKEQLKNSTWYFNGMGLDLTFGNALKNIYGGILIRGLKNLSVTNGFISGPSNVLKEIFSSLGSVFNDENEIKIISNTENISPIFKSTRIGLAEKDSEFFSKKYRYISYLCKHHKFKEKERVVRNLLTDNLISEVEAKEILDYNLKQND